VPDPDPRISRATRIRFGAFELNTGTGQFYAHGIPVKLQGKPLQVLEALLEKPGELVTRKELCERLWPAGTFVDFDSGINTATNRLRAALGDSAEAARYIETLPRLGYRFICPISDAEQDKADKPLPDKRTSRLIRNWLTRRPATGISVAVSMISVALLFLYLRQSQAEGHTKYGPSFHQLSFRSGTIGAARFLPGSKGAIFSVMEEDARWQTAAVNLDGSASRNLAFAAGLLASVSQQGKLALLAKSFSSEGKAIRLTSVSQIGGLIQSLADGTRSADWLPSGKELAVVRDHGAETLVEFPLGHVVYSSRGRLDCLRVSPGGDRIAFLEHPVRDDDGGYVRIVDLQARTRALTKVWSSAAGLAWSPSGDEVWFTASTRGAARELYAVSSTRRLRQISHAPSSLRLFDISSTGQVLIAVEDSLATMAAQLAGETGETDVSDLDGSHVDGMSKDGELVLFTEGGSAGGEHYSAYTLDRKTGRPVRFAAGRGLALSPDKRSALTIDPQDRTRLTLTVIKTGESRQILGNGYAYQWAKFLPDGRRLLVGGAFPQEPLTMCEQSLAGGKPVPLSGSPYMDYVEISPDGSKIAGFAGSQVTVFDVNSRVSRPLALGDAALPLAWSGDGKDLFLLMGRGAPYRIARVDLATGRTTDWKTIAPKETPGFAGLTAAVAAPEAGAYAYTAQQNLSRLYLVEGW